jgi:hypothetical protein
LLLGTVTWDGNATGAWNLPGNWKDDMGVHRVPAAGDDVEFKKDVTVAVDDNYKVKSVTVDHAKVVWDFQAVDADREINVSGDITLKQAPGAETSFVTQVTGAHAGDVAAAVPEASTIGVLLLGVVGVLRRRRKRTEC